MANRWDNFAVAVGSAVIIFALGLGANRSGYLGMGDVKLAVGLVLMLAWFVGAWALLLPIVVGVVVAVHILVGYRLGTLRAGSSLALGPHLIGSAVLMFGVGVF
jgi:prepilin signal peptidase PulO-like enzyme (type II secretory pathway)